MNTAQDWLLPVAEHCDPAELKDTIAALVDAVHPDQLDEAWARGMEKEDVKLAKTSDGYHLTGFLDILTGAEFKAWLDAASAPRDSDDDRSGSQRRTDALAELFNAALEHGLPDDRGVRPQLQIGCDLEILLATMVRQAKSAAPAEARDEPAREDLPDQGDSTQDEPTQDESPGRARLVGFGPIGDELLSYLGCIADFTAILTNGLTSGPTPQDQVLNVGRTRRLATRKQRQAIVARQDGSCANPGCSHTHLEIHHVQWWSRGGRTDLDGLVGLCRRCHILIHTEKLVVKTDGAGGFIFHRPTSQRLEDHRRTSAHAVRARVRALRRPRQPRRHPAGQPARCRHCGLTPGDQPSRQRPRAPMRV